MEEGGAWDEGLLAEVEAAFEQDRGQDLVAAAFPEAGADAVSVPAKLIPSDDPARPA